MSNSFTIILFLASFGFSSAQQVEFYNGSSFPASPACGEQEVGYIFESQMLYPQEQLLAKKAQEVFVIVKVSWDGKIDSISTNIEGHNPFSKEAIRLVKLIVWEKDMIRKGKNIEPQQVKITFLPKKYSRISKRRKAEPIVSEDLLIYTRSKVDQAPEVIGFKSINDYVRDNIKYPALALQQTISGTVKTTFVIEKNGKASNFKVVKPLAGGCNEETIRLLKNIIWKPGMKNGVPVRTISEYTLTYIHPGNTYR